MRRKLLWACLFGTIVVTGCAGGGGGGAGGGSGGGSTSNPVLRSVPYSTPVRVDSVKPMNSTAFESDSSALFSQSLSGNGEELITAGRAGTTEQGSYPTYNLNVFGWSNGSLVNRTSQWFAGNDNVILGTEPSIKFADFDGDGKKDMYVASNTDTTPIGSGWVYFNNGSNFTRVDLNLGVTGHDSAVYDLNGDGRSDIYTTGGRVSFSNANRTFSSHNVVGAQYPGVAGSVAIADFMGNGGSTILLTDQNGWQRGNNKLYSWEMIDGALNGRPGAQDFNLNLVATLPDSRFFLPKWSGHGFSGSHDYRALAFDFDNSGLTSAVVFSRPALTNGVWPDFNEIQFLKNKGGGTFIDVTDTTLVGYNTSSPTAYNPKLMDVNSDGLIDIVLGGTLNGTGAQVLIHTKEHKYVASYSAVIDAFIAQSATLEKVLNASAEAGGNGVVFVKGPDGSMYLATAITYNSCKGNCSSHQEKAIYLSKLGSTTASAQATAAAIKQVWPWMNDGQINTILAQSSTQWFGMNILDPAKAFQPIGELSIPLSGGKGLAPIRGYVMGLGLDNSSTVVTDSLGRGFTTSLKFMNVSGMNSFGYNTHHNDQHSLTSHAEYLVNGTPMTYGNVRVATENRYGFNGTGQGASTTTQNLAQYSIGIPNVYKKGKFSYGAQYTSLNTNPWIAFGGAWGSITNSGIFDNVVTYRDGGFSTQASLMHVTTNITPGLITKVNNIVGTWAESGYRFGDVKDKGDFGVYAGIKPVVLSGDVEAKMPTSIDNNGNVVYTNKKLAIQNQATPYIRALYTNMIDRKTMYRFSVMGTQQGQYRLMHEFRWWLD
jgi:hypothetical protein